jgi:ribose 5-phosphate isomerase B
MKIFIASDHAAFDQKKQLVEHMINHYQGNYEVIDVGTHSSDSTHYPEWVKILVRSVQQQNTFGILLCGSGIGVSMAANRYKNIRAALCRDQNDALMSRLHNDANVLCLSGRKTEFQMICKIVDTFLHTSFEGGRHKVRIDQFNNLGEP